MLAILQHEPLNLIHAGDAAAGPAPEAGAHHVRRNRATRKEIDAMNGPATAGSFVLPGGTRMNAAARRERCAGEPSGW